MINHAIRALIAYGEYRELIEETDAVFVRNRLLEELGIDRYEVEMSEDGSSAMELEEMLAVCLDYAVESGKIPDSVVYRDLLDTKLMGILTPMPREVIGRFWNLLGKDPSQATDWFYNFCQDTDYIRRYRIEKDRRWQTETAYGMLDITINLSKPEKDPLAIAAAKTAPQGGYPKCMLCKENEGYGGRVNHPARQNHRLIPIEIGGEEWFFQYSPYVYYNEHCIALNGKHVPMKIERSTFERMLDFLGIFPHYFVGSNADLPIVGGSILSHDHFQGGRHAFPMELAEVERRVIFPAYEPVDVGIVKWPMSVLRLRSQDKKALITLSEHILNSWREYSDESAFVFAETKGEPHNTITPIARIRDGGYEMDLVLRNNITTKEHPLGVFHPHEELHHIKKENIGLIEVMGLAVLPARLKGEMAAVGEALLKGENLREREETAHHAAWVEGFMQKREGVTQGLTQESIETMLEDEIGFVFARVLEDAGVFKRDQAGAEAFGRFVVACGGVL